METAIVPAAVAWDMFDGGPGKQCFLAAPPRGAKILEFDRCCEQGVEQICDLLSQNCSLLPKFQEIIIGATARKNTAISRPIFLQQVLHRPNFCFER